MNAEKPTKQKLVKEADSHKLYHTTIADNAECEFISCTEKSVLRLEGFDVCIPHGFRLIQCLTEKLKDDTVIANKE